MMIECGGKREINEAAGCEFSEEGSYDGFANASLLSGK